jgi:vacuolar-type H+-ATPase subunit H
MTTPTDDAEVIDEPIGRPPLEGALRELIQVEERIEVEVAEAKAEAQRIVQEAQRNAGEVELDGSTSLEEAIDALRASVEKECLASERELVERGETEARRYRDVDEATLRQLAQWVASRVAGGASSS